MSKLRTEKIYTLSATILIALGQSGVRAEEPQPAPSPKPAAPVCAEVIEATLVNSGPQLASVPLSPVGPFAPASTSATVASITSIKNLPPVGEGHAGAQKQFATSFVQSLALFDPTNLRKAEALRSEMRGFNEAVISMAPNLQSSALDTTINQLSTSQPGAEVGNLLLELDKTMAGLKFPTTFEDPPTTMAGKIWNKVRGIIPIPAIQRFFNGYKEAEGILQTQMDRINMGIEQQLNAINGEYQDNAQKMVESKLKLYDLLEFLKTLFKEVDAFQKTLPPDSEQAKFIQKEVLTHIGARQMSTEKLINTLQQAESALLLLIGTGRDLVITAQDEVAKAKVAIQAGVIIAVAINQQATLRKGTEAIAQTAQKIQDANAKNLLAHALSVQNFIIQSEQIDQLVTNAQMYEQMRKSREDFQVKRLEALKENLPKMDQVRKDFEQTISEQRKELSIGDELGAKNDGAKIVAGKK